MSDVNLQAIKHACEVCGEEFDVMVYCGRVMSFECYRCMAEVLNAKYSSGEPLKIDMPLNLNYSVTEQDFDNLVEKLKRVGYSGSK